MRTATVDLDPNRTLKILKLINDSLTTRHFPPSVREIGNHMGWTSTSTTYGHLQRLKDMGLIDSIENSPRAIWLTAAGTKYFEDNRGVNYGKDD